jgi:hypothetical protein
MTSKLDRPLYVVTAISNPVRYHSRYALYRDFAKRVADAGGVLFTAELAFGDRPFEVTSAEDCHAIQVRSFHELWHKENLLNLAIERLPPDWEYVAWVDADVVFGRPDWVQETIQQLQHYMVVQMFSHAVDLDPNCRPLQTHLGFVYSWLESLPSGGRYERWHPGYAWAARREALDYVGGLIDWAILGAADHHMATALIGRARETLSAKLTTTYKEMVLEWEARARKYIMRDIGYVDGTLLHHWHGKKRDRRYVERWRILTENHFDPFLDLKRDTQGLYQLTDRNIGLRDDLRRYFRSRNEDSIDL